MIKKLLCFFIGHEWSTYLIKDIKKYPGIILCNQSLLPYKLTKERQCFRCFKKQMEYLL